MKYLLSLIVIGFLLVSCGSSKMDYKDDKKAIANVLNMQKKEWNDNDLEGYMQSYWKSDDLKFYGSTGLTTGWNNVLENYKIRYPNKDHTGTLEFKIDNITRISENAYYVMGKYDIERKAGDANGAFMIILKKIDGQWKIIADMSS